MNGSELRSLVARSCLIADGGMGTSLVERGAPLGACFESLNVDNPSVVEEVHRAFVGAGARALWTNTFGANRFKLERHGRAGDVEALNRAGVEIARQVALGSGAGAMSSADGLAEGDGGAERAVAPLLVGSVGPLGVRLVPYGRVRHEDALEAYAEQIRALASAGVDLIAIETQSDLSEIDRAFAAAREWAPGVAVIVTATFTQDDRTLLGSTPEAVAEGLAELGADAIGVNCGQGPSQVIRIVRAMRRAAPDDLPLIARPNAGGPKSVGGRFLYPATPEYFADCASALAEEGVRLIGGCCGTSPAHIRAMEEAVARQPIPESRVRRESEADEAVPEWAGERSRPTELGWKLAAGRFVAAVEMEPPRGFSAARLVAAAESLVQAGADVIDVADSPMAKMRMSPWAACRLIQEALGVESVLHFPTRGRNLLRLQGDLLAAHALGIRNVFVCLGDPVTIGDFPHGSDNVDVTPTGVMGLITESFNRGTDGAGASIGEPTRFLVGCALAPDADDVEAEAKLLKRKVARGARFALSQPLYSPEPLERFRGVYEARCGHLELPILAGVLPLLSARHAEFIRNEVPGVSIPDHVLDRMRKAGERAEGEGLQMAVDLVGHLRELAAGVYVMPQFGRFDLAAEIVEAASN